MKQSTLEPGLLQSLRLYVILSAIVLPLSWHTLSPMFGVEGSFRQFITPGEPVLVFLVIYVSFPWWQRRMGRAFLPVAFLLLAAQSLFGNFATLQWLIAPQMRDLAALAFMLRVWVTGQFLVLFVAWQYDLFWVLVAGVGLCLIDAGLNFLAIRVNGPLYPFYIAIVVARLISVTAAGLGLAWLLQRQREQRAALAEANRKQAQYASAIEQLAASQERNRLARELHDTLAHSLSGVTVQLEAVEALWEVNAAAARAMLDRALQSTRSGLTEARRALQALRASPLEDLGLGLAVSDLAESVAARANLDLKLEVQSPLDNISPEIEQSVYRVAQEAMTNVARHSQARSLRVSLLREHAALVLTIADDGRGFDPASVHGAHYGLKGLGERAEMIGAALQVESRSQEGTTVRLVVPVAEVQK